MDFKPFFKPLLLLMMMMVFSPFFSVLAEEESEDTAEKEEAVAAEKSEKSEKSEVKAEENKEDIESDDEAVAESDDEVAAAVARPVSPNPIQVYGWREKVFIEGKEGYLNAKLDTGAFTSSIHAEEQELFERDGKKWVRFLTTDPSKRNSPRVKMEAPLVRTARIKEPGEESESREVVRLTFKIGERKLRGEFTLNDRSNMLSPVLIGRTTIRELGWIDPARTNLADKKLMR